MDQEAVGREMPEPAEAYPDSTHPELDANQPWIVPHEYETGGMRWFSDAVRELERALHPLLAQIPRVEVTDMPQSPPEGEPLPAEASPLYRPVAAKHAWTVHLEDVVTFNVEQLLTDLNEMAQDVGSQVVKAFIEHISDVSEQVGNVVSADGRDFFDVLTESIESMEITFDENGNHNLTLLVNPATHNDLKAPTVEQQTRMDAIMDRKREEWRAKRRRRDLP